MQKEQPFSLFLALPVRSHLLYSNETVPHPLRVDFSKGAGFDLSFYD